MTHQGNLANFKISLILGYVLGTASTSFGYHRLSIESPWQNKSGRLSPNARARVSSDRFLTNFSGRNAMVTFVTAGFPTSDATVGILKAMQEGGTDMIELGNWDGRPSNVRFAVH